MKKNKLKMKSRKCDICQKDSFYGFIEDVSEVELKTFKPDSQIILKTRDNGKEISIPLILTIIDENSCEVTFYESMGFTEGIINSKWEGKLEDFFLFKISFDLLAHRRDTKKDIRDIETIISQNNMVISYRSVISGKTIGAIMKSAKQMILDINYPLINVIEAIDPDTKDIEEYLKNELKRILI